MAIHGPAGGAIAAFSVAAPAVRFNRLTDGTITAMFELGPDRTRHRRARDRGPEKPRPERSRRSLARHRLRRGFPPARGRCRSGCGPRSGRRGRGRRGWGFRRAGVSNSLMRESLTPKTESPISICGSPSTKMWVTRVRRSSAVTMKCRWEARTGERPTASSILPTGPSCGIGYGVGVRPQNAYLPFVVGEQVGAAGDAAVGVLDVVEAVLVGFPDLDPGAGDGVAVGVGDGAFDPAGLAGGAAGDVPADRDFAGRPR